MEPIQDLQLYESTKSGKGGNIVSTLIPSSTLPNVGFYISNKKLISIYGQINSDNQGTMAKIPYAFYFALTDPLIGTYSSGIPIGSGYMSLNYDGSKYSTPNILIKTPGNYQLVVGDTVFNSTNTNAKIQNFSLLYDGRL